jgi:hypothetical protein
MPQALPRYAPGPLQASGPPSTQVLPATRLPAIPATSHFTIRPDYADSTAKRYADQSAGELMARLRLGGGFAERNPELDSGAGAGAAFDSAPSPGEFGAFPDER